MPRRTIIKPCPYCGGVANVKKVSQFGVTGIQIGCSKCGIVHAPIFASTYTLFRGMQNITFTLQGAAFVALETWNRRDTTTEKEKKTA